MKYRDFRDFLTQLEARGELRRVSTPVDPRLEMTEICDRVLRREDARYCGLIGSLSKRRRFEKRYRQQGMAQAVLEALVCPIGVDGITGKKPAEIAVAVAAEVLRVRDLAAASDSKDYPANVHPIGA